MVQPEYLATEILDSMDDTTKQFDLWEMDNLSDVYSLGLTFLEIVTLVPISVEYRTVVNTKSMMKPRKGLLSTNGVRSPKRIIEKQISLVNRMSVILEREVAEMHTNSKFFKILLRMIEPDKTKRIKLNDILNEVE